VSGPPRKFFSITRVFVVPNAAALLHLPDSAISMATLTRREALTAGVAWAKGLLASKERRNELCKQEFQESDADGGGELDDGEILTTIKRVCDKFQLPLPSDEKCSELFAKCDKNGDGSKLAKTRANHPYSHTTTCANPRLSPSQPFN
jgi:hypothetical protein